MLQIANYSRESCSEYSAPLKTLYVVTGTIVDHKNFLAFYKAFEISSESEPHGQSPNSPKLHFVLILEHCEAFFFKVEDYSKLTF